MVFGGRCIFHSFYLYDQSVGDKEVGGEGSMMIELCVMFNHGLSEDDVTIAVADCMSLYLVRRSFRSVFWLLLGLFSLSGGDEKLITMLDSLVLEGLLGA